MKWGYPRKFRPESRNILTTTSANASASVGVACWGAAKPLRISSSLCPRFPISRLSSLVPENHDRPQILNFTAD